MITIVKKKPAVDNLNKGQARYTIFLLSFGCINYTYYKRPTKGMCVVRIGILHPKTSHKRCCFIQLHCFYCNLILFSGSTSNIIFFFFCFW